MKIGVLGSGNVARTLAAAWATKGHKVFVGTREPNKPTVVEFVREHHNIIAGSLADAADFGDVILLAINPWTEIQAVLQPLAGKLKGKVLIDVSNNMTFTGQPALAFTDKSMGEYIQEAIPNAFVVKTLNITPAAMMVNPHQSGITPAIGWVSGNDESAKQTVSSLLKDLGWDEIVDLGSLHNSMLQENVGLILTLVVMGLPSSNQKVQSSPSIDRPG